MARCINGAILALVVMGLAPITTPVLLVGYCCALAFTFGAFNPVFFQKG